MAERVGFVPASPAHINNLGQFSIPQIARNTQNLSIRYKTGTAKFLLGRSLRGDILAVAVATLRLTAASKRLEDDHGSVEARQTVLARRCRPRSSVSRTPRD